jgi:fatty-acid desaturase
MTALIVIIPSNFVVVGISLQFHRYITHSTYGGHLDIKFQEWFFFHLEISIIQTSSCSFNSIISVSHLCMKAFQDSMQCRV